VDGKPKQDIVVTWLEHYIIPLLTILTVKNLIPRASFLYHTSVVDVSADIYLYICQLNNIDDDDDDDDCWGVNGPQTPHTYYSDSGPSMALVMYCSA